MEDVLLRTQQGSWYEMMEIGLTKQGQQVFQSGDLLPKEFLITIWSLFGGEYNENQNIIRFFHHSELCHITERWEIDHEFYLFVKEGSLNYLQVEFKAITEEVFNELQNQIFKTRFKQQQVQFRLTTFGKGQLAHGVDSTDPLHFLASFLGESPLNIGATDFITEIAPCANHNITKQLIERGTGGLITIDFT